MSKLRFKDERRLRKLLKDDSVAVVTNGRIKEPTNRPIWSVERDRIILENFDMETGRLLDLITKKIGPKHTPSWRYLSTIRSRLRKFL